jgi:2-dehydropantoate 2-reductase
MSEHGRTPIHVVGAGGIGSAVGRQLVAGGRDVLFVEANPYKVDWGRRVGLLDRQDGWGRAEFVPFADWSPPADAVVLLCVKCYDNAAVLPKVPPSATLIPIQNGFDPQLDALDHTYEGIASFVARCHPGQVDTEITRDGDLHFGLRSGKGGRLADLGRLRDGFSPIGQFEVKLVDRIEPIKHAKLMYNAAISPLAAAAGMDNGELLSVPAARRLFFALIQENYAILTAAGCELGKVGPFHPRTVARILRRPWLARLMAKAFEPSLRGTYCSMAGEIETGRTELDNYTGYLLRLAEKAGVPAPLNRAVYDTVSRMVMERAKPRREVVEEIASGRV